MFVEISWSADVNVFDKEDEKVIVVVVVVVVIV